MTLIRIPVFVDDRQVCCLFVLVMRYWWCSDDAMLLLYIDEPVMAYRYL